MWQCHVSSSECRCYRLNGFSLLKRFPLSADGACGKALDQPVGEWLEHVGLPQYESKFLLNGFDDLRFMVSHLQHVISGVGSTLHHSVSPGVNLAAFVFSCHHSALSPSACLSVAPLTPSSSFLFPTHPSTFFSSFPLSPLPFITPLHLCAMHDPAKIYGPTLNPFKEYGLSPMARRMITKTH